MVKQKKTVANPNCPSHHGWLSGRGRKGGKLCCRGQTVSKGEEAYQFWWWSDGKGAECKKLSKTDCLWVSQGEICSQRKISWLGGWLTADSIGDLVLGVTY